MRWTRTILALYVLVWFNVVVPGHTRGKVTLEGSADTPQESHSCCAAEESSTDENGAPKQEQKKHCAVCFVAATYTVADDISMDLRPAGLTQICVDQTAAQLFSLDYPPAFYPTGPPTAIA